VVTRPIGTTERTRRTDSPNTLSGGESTVNTIAVFFPFSRAISQKPMLLGSSDLTQKCFMVSPGSPFILTITITLFDSVIVTVNNNNNLFTYAKHFPDTPSSSTAVAQ